MTNIAIFASGAGSNAENIMRYFEQHPQIRVKAVLCNNREAGVIGRAQRFGIEAFLFTKKELWESSRVTDYLKANEIDYIVLSGFLLLLPPVFTTLYPNKIVNIHPSLLPKYGGKGMYGMKVHEAVVASGDTESGITIHKVNENYDDGQIICQKKCPVSAADTAEDVCQRVHKLEYEWFPRTIESDIKAMFKE